jgi:hypothetical protein
MSEHGAAYDDIGSKYDEYADTATLKRAECYTFFRMVGALQGKRILDLACGFGFYTRLLIAPSSAWSAENEPVVAIPWTGRID